MSKVAKFEDGRNVNNEIRDQFKQKGEEMSENFERVEGEVVENEKKKGLKEMLFTKKNGIIVATVFAVAGTLYGIYKVMTKKENIVVDSDGEWIEDDTTEINPEE